MVDTPLAKMFFESCTCEVGGKQELFSMLLQRLQSPNVLKIQKIYLVINQS
jgi:hypothetical protein